MCSRYMQIDARVAFMRELSLIPLAHLNIYWYQINVIYKTLDIKWYFLQVKAKETKTLESIYKKF